MFENIVQRISLKQSQCDFTITKRTLQTLYFAFLNVPLQSEHIFMETENVAYHNAHHKTHTQFEYSLEFEPLQ